MQHVVTRNRLSGLKDKLTFSERSFKIVYFHHPPYSSGRHGNTPTMQWPFEKWGVTAVFSGHDHNYQRIHKKDNPEFPYIINGLGGRDKIYECDGNPLGSSKFDSLCYNDNFGAMKVTASANRIEIAFISIDNPDNPIDEFVIEL